jgi:hypothetical protein
VHIDEGFDFLGWNFRKYNGKMLIKPSKKNVKAFYAKVRDVIDSSLSVPTAAHWQAQSGPSGLGGVPQGSGCQSSLLTP